MALSPITGHYDLVNQLNTQLAAGTLAPAATTTVNGTVKKAAFVAVPATFADLAAVRTYLAALSASLIAAGVMSAS